MMAPHHGVGGTDPRSRFREDSTGAHMIGDAVLIGALLGDRKIDVNEGAQPNSCVSRALSTPELQAKSSTSLRL